MSRAAAVRRTFASAAALVPALALLPLAACGRDARGAVGDVARVDSLPSPAGDGARWPNLATDESGRVYLTWIEPALADSAPPAGARDTVWRVRFATLDRGASAWSPARTVAEGRDLLANWADFPAVVPVGGGRIAAQWPVRTPVGRFAYAPRIAQSADGGATWTPAVAPQGADAPARAEYDFAVLFPAGRDSLGVAWLDGRAGAADSTERYSLYFATQAASGALGNARLVDTLTCSCCRSAVARTRRGVVVSFRDRQPDETRNIAVRRYEDGRWSDARFVHDDGWKIAGCPVNGTAAASAGDTVVVAWFTAPQNAPRVHVAFSADGGRTFSPPARADDGRPLGRVGVALTPRGDAVVSWLERTSGDGGADAELRVRRVGPDGAVGAARAVTASTSRRASGVPQLVAAGDTAYVAWTVPAAPGARPSVRVARLATAAR